MEEKKEVIEISLELQREIAKVFKVTERTVQSAMRFETKSPTARILRAYGESIQGNNNFLKEYKPFNYFSYENHINIL